MKNFEGGMGLDVIVFSIRASPWFLCKVRISNQTNGPTPFVIVHFDNTLLTTKTRVTEDLLLRPPAQSAFGGGGVGVRGSPPMFQKTPFTPASKGGWACV